MGSLCFNSCLPLDPPFFYLPQFSEGPPHHLASLSLKQSFRPRIVFFSGFFIFTWCDSNLSPEEEGIGWILLTLCSPALLIRTLIGWGWQGITKQLLSDKLKLRQPQAGCAKRSPWDTLTHCSEPALCAGPAGKQEEKSRAFSWAKLLSTTWVRSVIPKGLGPSGFGGGVGEECYTFSGDWLTGNSPSWKQKFRERILNIFWEDSHSWNWFGRQMASRNANQIYSKMKMVDSIFSFYCNLVVAGNLHPRTRALSLHTWTSTSLFLAFHYGQGEISQSLICAHSFSLPFLFRCN